MDQFDERRRRFLALAAPGMVWLAGGGLAACGGGGGDAPAGGDAGGGSPGGGSVPGSGTPGAAVSLSARLQTLESVRAAVGGLAAGAARFDEAALVQALRAMPALEAVGVSSAVGNVWARFTDGQYLVVPNNLEPASGNGSAPASPAADRRKRAAAGREADTPSILVGQQYRQLDMLGQVPVSASVDAAHLCRDWVGPDTLPNLRAMALGRGFVLPGADRGEPLDPAQASGLDGLSRIRGDGVFFLTAMAAQAGPDDPSRTVICVDTAATEANLVRYDAELKAGIVVHAVRLRGAGTSWEPFAGLAIGPEWPDAGLWSFPTECIGIFNLTGAPSLSGWVSALRRANLRHILGWSSAVPWQRLLGFADDLIQLNLATNNLDGAVVRQKSEPRLRAYGMGETISHLIGRGITGAASSPLDYLQEQQAALYVNALLPTIDYVTIKEHALEIELVGQFGRAAAGVAASTPSLPATARLEPELRIGTSDMGRFEEPLLARAAEPLLAGGQALASPLWQGGLLQTTLRPGELERGGYVQVVNGGRSSNAVPITHWEIPIQVVRTIDELTLTMTVTVRLRADVHGWRLEPNAFPRGGAPLNVLTGSVHSRADYSASGSISRSDSGTRTRTTISWSGSGGMGNQIGAFAVNFSGTAFWDSRRLEMVQIGVAGGGAYTQLTVTEQFDVNGALLRRTEESTTQPVSLSAFGAGMSGMLEMAFDDRWHLLAGGFDMLPVDSDILPAPPQRVVRTRLNWPQVAPDFPPRDDFGGT